MSADSEQSRIEWLQSLSDDEFQRMQKVVRGPVYTRRQIAKYLGTGAAAALAGGASTGAVAADASTTDGDGDVGTPSNRVDVFADGVDASNLTNGVAGSGNTLTSLTGPNMAIYNGRLINVLQVITKGSGAAQGSVHWRDDLGSAGVWRLQQRAVQNNTVEVISPIPIRPGTASNPTVVQWDAKVLNPEAAKNQYIGFGERFSSEYTQSIFVYDQGGTETFETRDGGTTTSTDISASVDMTTLHTYEIEWTDEPRATLSVDGTQVAEHTTNIDTFLLHPFFEIQITGTPNNQGQLWVSEDLLKAGAD